MLKGQRDSDKTIFAVKQVERTYVSTLNQALNQQRWAAIRTELQIMEQLDSPHVVKYIEFVNSEQMHFY